MSKFEIELRGKLSLNQKENLENLRRKYGIKRNSKSPQCKGI